MRISTAMISSALLILPLAASAQAEDGRVYYKGGTRVETEDMEVKFNVQLQPRYEFYAADSDRDADDTSEFYLRRARLAVSGNLLDDRFSFKYQDDLVSSNDMRYAWIQLNGPANVRLGQFKVPVGRQENTSSSKLFFVERSDVTNTYAPAYDIGAMVHGGAGEMFHWYAGIFNGEGRSGRGDDTEHLYSAAVDFVTAGYGKRGEEGDLDGGEFGATAGVSTAYQQDEFEDGSDFDILTVNFDGGIRVAGFDAQTEFYIQEFDADDVGDEPSFWGFYVQGTYTFAEKFGVGARYGFSDEDDFDGLEDYQEYAGVFNYFINGHALKAQAQITFLEENAVGGDSLTDTIFTAQLAGVF